MANLFERFQLCRAEKSDYHFINGVNYLNIRGYTLGIMQGIDESDFQALSERAIELPATIVGAVAVTLVFSFLGVRRLRRMNVP